MKALSLELIKGYIDEVCTSYNIIIDILFLGREESCCKLGTTKILR